MAEPQKEYIITDEKLGKLAKLAYYRGVGEEVANLVGEIRSRPYSSDKMSDAVLDMFYGRLEDATRESANNEFFLTWADIDCLYGEFKDELRQQEKGGA